MSAGTNPSLRSAVVEKAAVVDHTAPVDYFSVVAGAMALHVAGYYARALPEAGLAPLLRGPANGLRWLEGGEVGDCVIEDERGIVELARRGMVELRSSTARVMEPNPRMLVWTLVPDVASEFRDVTECARHLRAQVEGAGLVCFAKTNEELGLDVCVPLLPSASFEEVSAFAAEVARDVALELPLSCTADDSVAARKGRVRIVMDRNVRSPRVLAAYSPRRSGTTISLPVEWDELIPRFAPKEWTRATVAQRVARWPEDPLAHLLSSARPLRTRGRQSPRRP